jgi:histone acetyltransferase MCC1
MDYIDSLKFRDINPADREQIVRLHEQLFPVRYNPKFYDDMVQSIGINKGKLRSIITEDSDGNIVGFVLFQLFQYPSQSQDLDLFQHPNPSSVFYILTLGVINEYRRKGLASYLLSLCKEHAKKVVGCGGVSCIILMLLYIYIILSNKYSDRYISM